MKIALIYPPFLKLFGGRMNAVINGLCIMGAVLNNNGYDVAVYDADYDESNPDFSLFEFQKHHNKYLNSLKDIELPVWKELKNYFAEYSPDVIGITCMTAHWASVKNVADIFKLIYPDRKVVVGGHHPTAATDQVLSYPSVDYVVRGEGEYSFLELIKAIETGGDAKGVKGVSYKKDGEFIHNPERELIEDLDSLPFTDFSLMYKYGDYKYDNNLVFSARGCPHDCIFCASKLMWTRKPRYRFPEKVAEEIIGTYKATGRTEFSFGDDTFTINKSRAVKICELLKKSGINFKWSCMSTVKVKDAEFFKTLKDAGCLQIAFGVETGDEEGLKKLKKNTSIEEIKNAFALAKSLGFKTKAYIMYGFPWEDKEHIDKSIELIRELNPDSLGYSSAVPLPGTELFDMVKTAGFFNQPLDTIDWSHFHQYSPEMFFSNKVSRNEAYKLSLYAEKKYFVLDHGVQLRIKKAIMKILGEKCVKIIKNFLSFAINKK